MDRWDVVIVAVAAYLAVMTLIRLMANRRNELIEQARKQVEAQVKNKKKKKSDRNAA